VAYPDELLVEGELVALDRRPHWRVLVGPVLVYLIVLGISGYLAAVARVYGWESWGWPLLVGLTATLVVWLTVLPAIRWAATHLVVTTHRVLVREGVLRRNDLEIPLDRVVAVHARRSAIGRLVGCATLVLDIGSAGELALVDVPGVDHVEAFLHGNGTE
jgi:uncharacterized membrane protein YdbT with pleckstrin-like domain